MHGTRTTRDVLDDHLARRSAGDLEGDLCTNYDPDVMILHAGGALRGYDGVRDLNRQLSRYRATNSFQCHRLLTSGELGVVEWSGLGGRTDTLTLEGMESFIVRDGRIVAQTVHYSIIDQPLANLTAA
jgi:hypothetical protein